LLGNWSRFAAFSALSLAKTRLFCLVSLAKTLNTTALSRKRNLSHFSFLIKPLDTAALSRKRGGKRWICGYVVVLRVRLACGRTWPKSRGLLKRQLLP
jgi:hypothetical protein